MADYSEIIAHIATPPDFIMWAENRVTDSACSKTCYFGGKTHTPFFEALYIHAVYQQMITSLPTDHPIRTQQPLKADLPIFRYSALHNTLERCKTPTDNELMTLWKEQMDLFFDSVHPNDFLQMKSYESHEYDTIKVLACYGHGMLAYKQPIFPLTCITQKSCKPKSIVTLNKG